MWRAILTDALITAAALLAAEWVCREYRVDRWVARALGRALGHEMDGPRIVPFGEVR